MFYLSKFNQTVAGLFALCVKVQPVIKGTHIFKGFLEKQLSVSHCQAGELLGWVVSLCCRERWAMLGCDGVHGQHVRSLAVRASLGGSSPQELPGSSKLEI